MNSRIRFRTGITLGIVAAATLVGCGDDEGAQLPSTPDAGDAGVVSSGGETLTPGETSSPDVDSTSAPDTAGELDAGTEPPSDASTDETPGDASASTGDDSSDDSTGVTDGADSGVDSTFTGDDSTGASPDWVGLEVGQGTVTSFAVEPQGNDGYLGVVYDSAGNFYAVGTATQPGGDSYMAVTKFKGNGEVDESFGAGGVARKNVSVGGSESVRAITLQTVGETTYIVIAGTAQVDPSADGLAKAELDVAVVRFTLAGAIDESFGDDGVVSINFNTGVEGVANGNPAWVGNDAVWSIGTTQGDKLVLHGEQRNEGVNVLGDGGTEERSDVDWVLVRLLADGTFDNSFGNGGKVTLDLAGAGASARSATVLEDGSIIGTGYLSSTLLVEEPGTQQPVIYKVNANGQFDASFATADAWDADGVFHDYVVAADKRAEAYGAVLQGNKLVTMGYGPTNGSGAGTDFIALRFTADGAHDKTFGTNGVTYIDAAGQRDNGRSLVVLPDETILGIGGGSRLLDDNTTTVTDGMLVLLSPNGAPIQSFGDKGVRLYELGGSNDFFWAGAVSPDQNTVAIVGIKGTTGEGDDADTDGAVLVLPLSHFNN